MSIHQARPCHKMAKCLMLAERLYVHCCIWVSERPKGCSLWQFFSVPSKLLTIEFKSSGSQERCSDVGFTSRTCRILARASPSPNLPLCHGCHLTITVFYKGGSRARSRGENNIWSIFHVKITRLCTRNSKTKFQIITVISLEN